jgi:ATP-dependent exoDNAse (exonuclease V) beta subunit
VTRPSDQAQRDRFIHEIDRNFSVVASAGSGKTRAITDRIAAIAASSSALEILPKLVIVTYTNRAANEMRQRAQRALREAGASAEVMGAFRRAFFGTIHSFCLRLIQQHGHYLGLSSNLRAASADDPWLWAEFVQRQGAVAPGLSLAQRRDLLRLIPARSLLDLARVLPSRVEISDPGEFPVLDFSSIYAFAAKGAARRTVAETQERLREWEDRWRAGEDFVDLPESRSKAAEFVELWQESWVPAYRWIQRCALRAGTHLAEAFRAFRAGKGLVTFDDQIALARELLQHEEAAAHLRKKSWRIILDEAQDTDPLQFDVLIELARPPEARGAWPEAEDDPPRPGHFSMVGDFQQSIYGERADLAHYRRIHDALVRTGAGEEVKFSVTFRLDSAPIDFVNTVFAGILHGEGGQVPFVRLDARPAVLPGQVVRCEMPPAAELDEWSDFQRANFAARNLARWLKAEGLDRLRAPSWSEVAILCPRKSWLNTLRAALRAEELPVQMQSDRDVKGDRPAYAWLTALATAMVEPRNSYEVAGILREVFGLSDHDLAVYAQGDGRRFCLDGQPDCDARVGEVLALLADLRVKVSAQPLFTAVRTIADTVSLRERLRLLPREEFGECAEELDALLALAAGEEAHGATLADFARMLRRDFRQARENRSETRDAIQLITAHKAKGSEWCAVVIPFFCREIRAPSPSYPRVVRTPRSSDLFVALDGAHLDPSTRDALKAAQRNEFERLLYVAMTRARHTLVIVDDEALFATEKGAPPSSQAKLLRMASGDENHAALKQLSHSLRPCADTESDNQKKRGEALAPEEFPLLPPLPTEAAELARSRSARFIKRNPSALAEPDDSAGELASNVARSQPNSGALYGLWWHALVEKIDWTAGEGEWERVFAEHAAFSPDLPRSEREWQMLRAVLAGDSPFTRALRRKGVEYRAELPFLWRMSDRECLEGIFDLCIFDPASGQWLIVDWKTNQIGAEGAEAIHERYTPQLAAYVQALSAMSRAPTSAGIYITSTAEWLPYAADDLARCWQAIRERPEEIARALDRAE